MTHAAIPHGPDDIDAAWLTAALATRHPGVRVAAVRVRETRQVTNTHAFLHIDYAAPTTAPPEMFCKRLPLDPARR